MLILILDAILQAAQKKKILDNQITSVFTVFYLYLLPILQIFKMVWMIKDIILTSLRDYFQVLELTKIIRRFSVQF